ncbi:PIR protein [Plasmodium vivax]|uniref:VIR protein n=1 Tax=Plasmodium vivax TaxID=5855 RepID=A0A565A4C5_PLAVI|nr:PIR protein [Plasmodium vivax]
MFMFKNDISENDLPSVKFENEIKDLIDYSTFESYKKNITESDKIDKWIESFQEKLEAYSIDSSEDSSPNQDKRCKHFNYLLNFIINKLNSLSRNPLKILEWSEKIRESRKKILLSNNNNLNCNENNRYSGEDDKLLGTFCEDSAFIRGRMNEIENSVYCSNIANNMISRKNILINVRDKKDMRAGRILKFDDKCSIHFLDDIHPSITCNSSVHRQSQVEAPSLNDKLEDSGQSDEQLKMLPLPASGDLTTDIEGLVTTSAESEPIDGQSSNTLNTVGLPIFGVLGCSFLLYKFTPVGSIFRSRIQNKGIIPINNDDYSIKQILSNTPNNNDIYSENTQYNISYQTL